MLLHQQPCSTKPSNHTRSGLPLGLRLSLFDPAIVEPLVTVVANCLLKHFLTYSSIRPKTNKDQKSSQVTVVDLYRAKVEGRQKLTPDKVRPYHCRTVW